MATKPHDSNFNTAQSPVIGGFERSVESIRR